MVKTEMGISAGRVPKAIITTEDPARGSPATIGEVGTGVQRGQSGMHTCSRKIDRRKMNRRRTSSRGLYFSVGPDFCNQAGENLRGTTRNQLLAGQRTEFESQLDELCLVIGFRTQFEEWRFAE